MARKEIINKITGLGLTRQRAKVALDTFIKEIGEALKRQERAKIAGLGVFYVKDNPARKGMNPKTGEKIQIQAKKYPVFKPSPELRSLIND